VNADLPEGKMAEKTFINRWSQTKLADTDKVDEPDQLAEALPDGSGDEVATTEEQVVADLPPIESLDGDSDYTGFLGENVPEELARKALRKLWTSNPVFANLDGLNDYDDDYSALGIVEMVVETAYKVGKGLVEEDEAEIEEELAEDEAVSEDPVAEQESSEHADDEPSQLAEQAELPVPHGGKD